MARQSLKNEEFEQTKTVLDEEASIYQKREETTKETWKNLEGKSKARFFVDYYLLRIVIIVVVVGFVAYASYLILRPKTPTCFYMAFLYADVDNVAAKEVERDFAKALGVDPEKYLVTISDDYYLDDHSGLSASEKLLTYAFANQIDIIVAEENEFEKLASSGNMMDLSAVLEKDVLELYGDSVFRCAFNEIYLDGEEDSTEYTFGLYMDTKNELYKKLNCMELEKPVFGICASTRNPANAIRFIKFINGIEVEPMTAEELDILDGKDVDKQETKE